MFENQLPPMPKLAIGTENEFAIAALMLNMVLMPAASSAMHSGQELAPDLRDETSRKVTYLIKTAPLVSAELMRRADRIAELEAQIAADLLAGANKKEGD